MTERDKHLFQFSAQVIALAAEAESEYHRRRQAYWEQQQDEATEIVRRTAGVKIQEQPVTGGKSIAVVVDYGDPAAYQRLQLAYSKLQAHRQAAERFETEAKVYGTQGDRSYELEAADVHYFRLGGGEREE